MSLKEATDFETAMAWLRLAEYKLQVIKDLTRQQEKNPWFILGIIRGITDWMQRPRGL